MTIQQTDIAIIGCGMVGGALALGLAKNGFKITIIEQNKPKNFNYLQKPNVRISALNIKSVKLLKFIGVWDTVISMRVHPYSKIELWDLEIGYVSFNATDIKQKLLGYMIENHVLKIALWKELNKYNNIILKVPNSLQNLKFDNYKYKLKLKNNEEIITKLVIGADGANSIVRKICGIKNKTWNYKQSCLLITVICDKSPGNCTWQHFTPNGPKAFLPLFDNWASLVWYDTPERIQQLQNLSMDKLKILIKKTFPTRIGNITPIETWKSNQLFSSHALQYINEGCVLIGDAAHTIHPLSGQGLNLGYKDVYTLLNILIKARNKGEHWASNEVLKRYENNRLIDNYCIQYIIYIIYILFNNNKIFFKIFRNLCLNITQRTKIIKFIIMKYILGI